jgi:aspartate/methionine/tyrosine aminotransferase
MKIAPFAIEQFFARYEFTTPRILCASDCETMSVAELLTLSGHTLAELGQLRLGYTESQGHPEWRTAVSRLYQHVHPDAVVELNAPEEGIFLAAHALLEPGDHVVVLTPAYQSLLNLAAYVSGNVSEWAIQPVTDGWEIDLPALAQLVTPQTRLIIVNFPHNPTGFLPTRTQFETVIEIARQNNAWLFCDEMYRGLELEPAQRLPSAADDYDRTIVLSGLSKVHGLPGLRSGWLVVTDVSLREQIIDWKYYTSICPPAPSEFLALTALSVHEQLAARNRTIISQNLPAAAAFFARWPQRFTWRPPSAGSVALVGFKNGSATAYCHQLAQEAGILLLPSSCLGYGDNYIRLGLGRADFVDNLAHYEKHLLDTLKQ